MGKQHLAGHVEGVLGFCALLRNYLLWHNICPMATGVHRFQVAPTTFQMSIAAREMYIHFWAIFTICPTFWRSILVSVCSWGASSGVSACFDPVVAGSFATSSSSSRKASWCCYCFATVPTGPAPPPAVSWSALLGTRVPPAFCRSLRQSGSGLVVVALQHLRRARGFLHCGAA